MLPMLIAATAGILPCWDIFDAALRHSALSEHPPFVTYDERISITEDNQRIVQSVAHVEYRDDGVARVRDERFDFEPIVTRRAEPGPPELGPYGSARQNWLPQSQLFRTIAAVRSDGDLQCFDDGVETYKGHSTYHLQFVDRVQNRPALEDLWVDTQSDAVWKLETTGYVYFAGDDGGHALADFQVEFTYAGSYLVVDHVVWQYTQREYSQTSNFFGEYTLSGYRFPQQLPSSHFRTNEAYEP